MKKSLFAVVLAALAATASAQTGPLDSPLEITVTVTVDAGSPAVERLIAIASWPVPDYDIGNHYDIDVFFFVEGGFARWQTVPLSRGWVELESVDLPVHFEARHRDLGGVLPCVWKYAD